MLFDKDQGTLIEYPGGVGGSYTIPPSVTRIAGYAFASCSALTDLTISGCVFTIGDWAFSGCQRLASVTIPGCGTSIGSYAFYDCPSLARVTIGIGVISIYNWAFAYCNNLTGVYCNGNAPILGSSVFRYANNATVYYLPGTTGWGATFGGLPAMLWNTQVQPGDGSFGVQRNQFGFTITGSSNLVIMVEACTNPANPTWSPVGTNTLTGGSSYFSDPQWTNYPARFYRLRSP